MNRLHTHQNTLHQEFSQEFRFFSFFKSEKGIDMFRPDPIEYLLQVAPERVGMLRSILNKIGFNFSGIFIVDLLMPGNIGGYYHPNKHILAINPYLLLTGSEQEIAHVLYHEGLHSGMYTKGTKLMEEVVVETMTKKKMEEVYGESSFKSGYDNMVKDAEALFGELPFDDMKDLVEEKEDEEAFDRFMNLAVVKPTIREKKFKELGWDHIQRRLKQKWGMFKELFPRTINSIAKNNRGLHEAAGMEAYQFKLEGLLAETAKDVLSNHQDLLVEILLHVTDNGNANLTFDSLQQALLRAGFGYLYDTEPDITKRMMLLFISQVKLLQAQNEEVLPDKIGLVVQQAG